jgi:phytol kinase
MKNNFVFYVPISFLTLSDTVAEWGGKKWGDYTKMLYNKKTVAGSLSFAVCSLLLVIAWGFIFHLTPEQIIIIGLTTTMVATIAELVSPYGLDNITVPVVTLLCLLVLYDFLQPL